jgi:cobalamin biosynthesis protein CobD/CbiB
MNDLHKALGDISSIRREMARTTQFRGYGPATLAVTAAFAALAAVAQALWLPDPASHIRGYLGIWISTALLSATLTGAQMYTRSRRIHSGLSDEMIRMAVEQFLPSIAAGLLLTIVMVHYVPSVSWMLPGLWQVIFSIGVFSSCRFLPRPMIAAGVWYLFTGLLCIALGNDRALAPATMGLSFGIGQMIVAAILLFATPEPEDEN